MEIVYCERCGRIIPPSEAESASVLVTSKGTVCPQCIRTMPAEERGALGAAGRGGAGGRASRRQSSTRLAHTQGASPKGKATFALAVAGLLLGMSLGIGTMLAVFRDEPKEAPVVAMPALPPAAADARGGSPTTAESSNVWSAPETKSGETVVADARQATAPDEPARREEALAEDGAPPSAAVESVATAVAARAEAETPSGPTPLARTAQPKPEPEATAKVAATETGGGRYLAGLLGKYYADRKKPPVMERVDNLIDFRWPPGPCPELERFRHVQWTGQLRIPEDGEYTLDPWTRDRARLIVDGRTVFDSFVKGNPRDAVKLELKKGWVPIELHYNAGGMTEMHFRWSGPSHETKLVGAEDTRVSALLSAGTQSATVTYVDGMAARPDRDGYLSSPEILYSISTKFAPAKVEAKTIGAIGGTVAGGRTFDSTLSSSLGESYEFARKRGIAGRGATGALVLRSLPKALDRAKPEVVRVAFDVVDPRTGAPSVDESSLTQIVNTCLARGAVPVLFTAFVMKQRDAAAQKLLDDHNALVLNTAEKLKVPCVDAYGILNGDPAKLGKHFSRTGALRLDGLKAVNARFVILYRVLEKTVMGRNVEVPKIDSPRVAEREVDPPGPQVAQAPRAAKASPPPAPTRAEIDVVNGGFETRSPHDSFAASWIAYQWGEPGARYTARMDKTNPHEGTYALVVRAVGEGAKPGAFTQLALEAGTYEISYWACADIEAEANVLARFGETVLPGHTVSEEWHRFTDTLEVKDKRTRASLGVLTTTPKTRVWFDDIRVTRIR